MKRNISLFLLVLGLVIAIAGCSKDDNPAGPGGGISTINFTDPSPSVTVAAGTATSVRLAGGTLPYTVQTAPNASVAIATISNDTLTITPVGAGSTSVTVADATPAKVSAGATVKLVTISIIVNGEEGGGGSPFDFPIPDIAGIDGGIGVVHEHSAIYGDFDYAIAVFEGSTSGTFVYGGAVTVNSIAVDSLLAGDGSGNVFYLQALNSGDVHFDNSSTTNFTVAGQGIVPAFNGSIVAPTVSHLTAPANNAAVSRSSNLTITWDGTGADSVLIVVADDGGHVIAQQGLVNNGSYTVSASALAGMDAGFGTVHVTKYRYNIVTAGSKHYAVVMESDSFAFITFN